MRYFANARNVVLIRCGNVQTILLFLLFIVVFTNTVFALFVLVTIDVVHINSLILNHIDSSCHFLGLNYRGLNLNFLKLKQLLICGDVESNLMPTQKDCKSSGGRPKKIKIFQRTPKNCDLSENINFNVASDQGTFFSFQFNQSV